jgi:dienelactone hydrolase
VYDIGAGAGVRQPPAGTLRFAGAGLSWEKQGAAAVRGTRVPVRQVEARVRSGAITLGCTLSLPAGGGPHPAVALVHGSGAVDRSAVGFQTGFYLRHGIAMLACDKRGIGQSGGRYPGELASESAIDVLARDAEAGARFLAAQPEIDRSRIGLSGASQAGWTMPLAASREPAVRFLVLFVAPTVTQGESDHYGQLTGQGATVPEQSPAEIEADVRRQGPSGVDPVPWIRSLRIPALWLFGSNDQHVPTRLSVERLDPLTKEPGRDFSYAVLPGGNHGLVETEHGLNAEAERSSRFAPGLFPTLGRWLSGRRLTGSPG